jgi:hypothetical protein
MEFIALSIWKITIFLSFCIPGKPAAVRSSDAGVPFHIEDSRGTYLWSNREKN